MLTYSFLYHNLKINKFFKNASNNLPSKANYNDLLRCCMKILAIILPKKVMTENKLHSKINIIG